MVGRSEILTKIIRENHDAHCTFESFVKTVYRLLRNILIISDDGIPALSCLLYGFAVEYLLQFTGKTSLILLRSLIDDVP